jgi:hypothetical protein
MCEGIGTKNNIATFNTVTTKTNQSSKIKATTTNYIPMMKFKRFKLNKRQHNKEEDVVLQKQDQQHSKEEEVVVVTVVKDQQEQLGQLQQIPQLRQVSSYSSVSSPNDVMSLTVDENDHMKKMDIATANYNALHAFIQSPSSSLATATKILNDEIHSQHPPFCWKKVAIQYFQDPKIKPNDKIQMVHRMSKQNLQFQLLDHCNDICIKKNKTKKKNRIKNLLKRGMKMRKVPNVIVVKSKKDEVEEESVGEDNFTSTSSILLEQRHALRLLHLLIDFGGKEFVMMTEQSIAEQIPNNSVRSRRRNSAITTPSKGSLLHSICRIKYDDENESLFAAFANRLLDIGGKELVILQNEFEHTALHEVIYNNPSSQSSSPFSSSSSSSSSISLSCMEGISKKMIDIGGDELIEIQNRAMAMEFSTMIPVDIMSH